MNPLILIILDGWGIREEKEGNAILLADTPNFDRLHKNFSSTQLKTHGTNVGLMEGMMGGSEVGHLDIGAGRVVVQNVARINQMIKEGSFLKDPTLLAAVKNVKENNSALHLMGLLSDAGVHSIDKHLYALLELASEKKIEKVFVHAFTDGRDTPIRSAEKYIKRLQEKIKKHKTGKIATIIGRYYAMDRDKRWQRTKRAYRALIQGKGKKAEDALSGLKVAYKDGESDEFIKPIIVDGFSGIKDGDSVIFFNYRADRARQLTKALVEPGFDHFEREKKEIFFVGMTRYYKEMPASYLLETREVQNTIGEVLSKEGMRQLRIAETEKYAHVTYFLNGMKEKPLPKEDRILVPSPKVATYDLQPGMSAPEITEKLLEAIKKDKYSVIFLNFANPDMVGHTGDLKAAIKAVETVDECLGRIVALILEKKGTAVITADHGNAEEMINIETKEALSEHSKNPVPFIIVSDKKYKLKKGKLADIAPTLLELLGIEKPKEMTAQSLIKK
ncbi:MAG: 2,3-bisphosphoglycerate-independent phosphoglycerate mutase [Candidatus Nealsonbacteria bacterium]|nr:2,3-bisphosphoglycerate-independent phosphoglycerate mutase [Candidatus Nealsonbacteria bacterium]